MATTTPTFGPICTAGHYGIPCTFGPDFQTGDGVNGQTVCYTTLPTAGQMRDWTDLVARDWDIEHGRGI